MLQWCSDFKRDGPYNFFEVFAGAANVTKWWCLGIDGWHMGSIAFGRIYRSFNIYAFVLYLRHKCGFKCASFDVTYSQNESRPGSMDFLHFSGFLYLAQQMASDHISIVYMIGLGQIFMG